MDLLKKLAVAGATVSLALGLYAVPVLGAADASNDNISDDSFADSEAYDVDTVNVGSTNLDQELDNFDVALANTGLNSQNGNEDGNDLSASNASADYETANFLNVNEAFGQDGASASNSNISDGSDGDALADDSDTINVTNRNEKTNAFNLTLSVANTGLNRQNNNEDGNTMMAGSAWSYAGSSNVVNHNLVSGGNGSSAIASNSNITNDSFADSEAYDNDTVTVKNTNKDTTFKNYTVAISNSGLNQQNGNEDGNSMTTGDTGSGVVAENYVNVNETLVGGSSAYASNSNISGGSDGDAVANDGDTVSVTNNNTTTNVTNVSVAVANSGGNTQNNNEDGNSTTTGSAQATGSTVNVVNANQVSW